MILGYYAPQVVCMWRNLGWMVVCWNSPAGGLLFLCGVLDRRVVRGCVNHPPMTHSVSQGTGQHYVRQPPHALDFLWWSLVDELGLFKTWTRLYQQKLKRFSVRLGRLIIHRPLRAQVMQALPRLLPLQRSTAGTKDVKTRSQGRRSCDLWRKLRHWKILETSHTNRNVLEIRFINLWESCIWDQYV